jgi:hypothetical protein
MSATARIFDSFIRLALEHPDGAKTARVFDRVFQFDLTDDAPFYMEISGGKLTVKNGDSGLDWKYRDWERVTCVHTSGKVLRAIVAGRTLVTEAFFDRQLGFAPRRMAGRHLEATAIVTWFYTLFRLAHEQAQRVARENYLSKLGLGEQEQSD